MARHSFFESIFDRIFDHAFLTAAMVYWFFFPLFGLQRRHVGGWVSEQFRRHNSALFGR